MEQALELAGKTLSPVAADKVRGQQAQVFKDRPEEFEPYVPTIARMMPLKIKRRNSFSATNDEKARLHQTKPPNALPASL